MATNTKVEGTYTFVDDEGNTVEMYPNLLTDKTLTISNKAADAAVVGEKLNKVLYIDSFDSSTGTLTTKSSDYEG